MEGLSSRLSLGQGLALEIEGVWFDLAKGPKIRH